MGAERDMDDHLSDADEKGGRCSRLSRRKFLKLTAMAGLSVGAIGIHQESNSAPSVQPGDASTARVKWISTSCLNCPARCGMTVKVVGEKAVRIKGNRLSLISEGEICPRGHIGLQVLYDPERVLSPLKRSQPKKGKGIDPQWKPISWDQAIEEVVGKLRTLRDTFQPHHLLLLSGLNSRSNEDLLSRFAEAFGTPNLISGDGLDREAEKTGNWMADGHFDARAYDLDQTNYLLSFGADLLESTPPVSRWLRKWGKLRREKPIRTRIVDVQPRYSLTASKSDEWIPIKPGTDAALAMAMAHVIIRDELFDHKFVKEWTAGFDQYRQIALQHYAPETVSKITGIPAETISRIAGEFARTRPALAIPGKGAIARPGGAYTSYAIHCLNALVGSIDAPGGVLYQESPGYRAVPNGTRDEIARKGFEQPSLDLHGTEGFPAAQVVTNQVPKSLLEGKPYPIRMAIGFNSNFNMIAPSGGQWEEALKKIPFYVHVAPFVSEMAEFADLILPSTTFFEEWGYDHSSPGGGPAEARIKQPVVKPMGDSKSIGDILFLLAERVPGGVIKAFKDAGGSAEGFVRFRTSSLLPWEEFLKKGVWKGPAYQYGKYPGIFHTPSRKFEFVSGNLRALDARKGRSAKEEIASSPHYSEMKWQGEEGKYPLVLFPYQPLLTFGNGSQNYPWAQEIFLPLQGVGWASPAEINSETARTLNLRDRDEVWVESPFGKIRTHVKVSEGIHPGIVCIPCGQGHSSYGKWQKGIGCNPNEVIGVDFDALSGQSAFFNTRVKVYKA
jgi:thiosulfate reductase / polysulfide reductase chain A